MQTPPTTSEPQTATTDAAVAINPLASIPSVLAIRDIRDQITLAAQGSTIDGRTLVELLELDPLCVLRCLRAAHADVNSFADTPIATLPDLVRLLGRTVVQRAIDIPAVDSAGTGPLRELWLHSVATALAARDLAEAAGTMDPEAAYLQGLLHDLHHWIHYLGHHHRGEPWPLSTAEWLDDWRLPSSLIPEIRGLELGARDPIELVRAEPRALVAAAEMLAELADYPHPGEEDTLQKSLLLAEVTKETLIRARELRRTVLAYLADRGIIHSRRTLNLPVGNEDDSRQLFPSRRSGGSSELIITLLHCSRSSTYRGITTLATSAALRYLDFERAYFLRWNRRLDVCWVRAKADFSIHPIRPRKVRPTAEETGRLASALQTERPQLLERRKDETGLLAHLGSDEALITPVSREFDTPTFLVLDRGLSGRGLDLDTDAPNAAALGGTVAILIDNLQLRLQRIRAQRFALTDPLTRLANRGVGMMGLQREIARAQRDDHTLTCLMLDLDEFKDLNDTYGHVVGDQALRLTANVLRKNVRGSDIVCRYGGEEFLVVLPNTPVDEASILAARLFTEVEKAGTDYDLPLTVSIGLGVLREDDTTESIVQRADRALYASKSRGRNRFSVDIDG